MDLDEEEFVIKIADFGYARHLNYDQTSESWFGTPLLMAPEVLFGKKYGRHMLASVARRKFENL